MTFGKENGEIPTEERLSRGQVSASSSLNTRYIDIRVVMKAPPAVITLSIRHDTPPIFLNFSFYYTPKSRKISPGRPPVDLFTDIAIEDVSLSDKEGFREWEAIEIKDDRERQRQEAYGMPMSMCALIRVYILLVLSGYHVSENHEGQTLLRTSARVLHTRFPSAFLLALSLSTNSRPVCSIEFMYIFFLTY